MLDELTVEQLGEWRVYIEGVGTESWHQAATIANAVDWLATAVVGALGGKGGKLPDPDDRIPLVRPEDEESDVETGLARLEKALERMTWQS